MRHAPSWRAHFDGANNQRPDPGRDRGPFPTHYKEGIFASEADYTEACARRSGILETVDRFSSEHALWLPVSPSAAIPHSWDEKMSQTPVGEFDCSTYLRSYLAPTTVLGAPVPPGRLRFQLSPSIGFHFSASTLGAGPPGATSRKAGHNPRLLATTQPLFRCSFTPETGTFQQLPSVMKAITVGLVDIGENLPFKLKTLIGKLNGLQRSFVFEHAGVVTSEALGTPDLKGKWYEIPRLWELAHAAAAKHCDLVIGVTKCRITHSGEKPDPADLDYFSRSDLKKVAVMSVNKSVLKFNAPGKSMLQFAAFIMVEEVMIMMSRVSLNHTKNAHCAFNECEEKDLFPGCMEHGQICHSCLIEIKKAGIADEFVASARAILRWCGKNTWTHAMNHTSKHPVPALFLGIGLGWFSSVYIEKQHYLAMLIVTVVPVVLTLLISKTTRAEAQ